MDIEPVFWIIVASVVLFFLVAFFFCLVRRLCHKYVLRKSLAIKAVEFLNRSYASKFNNEYVSRYYAEKHQKSRASFDRANHHEILMDHIQEFLPFYMRAIQVIQQNKWMYDKYSLSYTKACIENMVLWKKGTYFFRLEERFLNTIKLKPTISLEIKVYNMYTSPKGYSQDSNYICFDMHEIKRAIQELDHRKKVCKERERERSLVTNSVRYNIMQRDGFCCVLCGASKKDGVKLHVDHIVPIAKGGKSTMNNLRTLCDRCNLGKRDKYDPARKN